MSSIFFPLLALQLLSPPQFEAQTIDANVNIGYGLAVGDVDGDRKPDILLADKKQFVWYRNGDWKRFVMAENLTQHDNVCIAARDIDGDGRVEVAVGAQWNPAETTDDKQSGAVFFLKRPADPTGRWESVQLYHEPTIHRMRWAKVDGRRFQLIVVPLHGRGNQNGRGAGVKILAFDVPKNPSSAWKHTVVDSTLHLTHNFEIVEDGPETRLWLGGREGVKTVRFQKGKWVADGWVQRGYGTGEVRRGTFANGGVFSAAVEPMHGHQLVVYQPADTTFRHVLTENMNQGHAVACDDLLGLGSTQVVVGWRTPNADGRVGIRLFVPADNTGRNWQEHVIDDNRMACEDLLVADLNADNRPDIIAAGRDTHNLVVYWSKP
ncbi:MAG: VCBS repeat-containing protein [Cytophagales bacterium]|nr:VCBS repeat-containing protein [Cytophagales bacterium]